MNVTTFAGCVVLRRPGPEWKLRSEDAKKVSDELEAQAFEQLRRARPSPVILYFGRHTPEILEMEPRDAIGLSRTIREAVRTL